MDFCEPAAPFWLLHLLILHPGERLAASSVSASSPPEQAATATRAIATTTVTANTTPPEAPDAIAGVLRELYSLLAGAGVELSRPGWLFAVTPVLSNLVSNVPAVMLLLPAATGPQAGAILALASTFAGNLLIVGSIANIIVVERARQAGVALGFVEHAGDLGPGQTYAGMATFTLPGVLPGDYFFIVRANASQEASRTVPVRSSTRSRKYSCSGCPCSTSMPAISWSSRPGGARSPSVTSSNWGSIRGRSDSSRLRLSAARSPLNTEAMASP